MTSKKILSETILACLLALLFDAGAFGQSQILGGAKEHSGCRRDFPPALEFMLIAQRARDLQQRDAIEIKYGLGLRMVARLHAIAGLFARFNMPVRKVILAALEGLLTGQAPDTCVNPEVLKTKV